MNAEEIYRPLGVSPQVCAFGERVLDGLRERFAAVDRIAEANQAKVLAAMQKNRVSAACFAATTGYGYDDVGRDKLERVYADTFHTEAALVRPQITCGTHALTVALSANLLPGDELLSPVGAPYDTLEEVIGIRPSPCSLREYGVSYWQADLKPDGTFDYEAIRACVNEKTKLATIQRSKGYATRPTFSVQQIGELIAFLKSLKPDIICMVDNCYGEFVEPIEPTRRRCGHDRRQPHQEPRRRPCSHRRLHRAAGRTLSSAAPTASLRPALGRRSVRTSACCRRCIRASSLPRPLSHLRSRARSSRPISMSALASASFRTARSPATTSFRPWSSARARV